MSRKKKAIFRIWRAGVTHVAKMLKRYFGAGRLESLLLQKRKATFRFWKLGALQKNNQKSNLKGCCLAELSANATTPFHIPFFQR